MKKKLLLMNGRGYHKNWHLYVAAYSKADASRMLANLHPTSNAGQWLREINVYFSVGRWGKRMNGITPVRGIWEQADNRDKPVRVL